MKKLTSKQKDEVIEAMTRRIIFAVNNYKWQGGFVRDAVTGKTKTPIYWFADALKLVGIEFEKDDLDALHKSAKERRAYFKAKLSESKVREGE